MVRAIVWKELREQWLIALTLLVLGSGILVAAAVLADPPSPTATAADVVGYLGAGRLATLLLAVTAGTVCGGALFAAEREAGTMGFLESLPAAVFTSEDGMRHALSMLDAEHLPSHAEVPTDTPESEDGSDS